MGGKDGGVSKPAKLTEECTSCARHEGAVNHVPGHVFVGWGHGWQPCPVCGGSGDVLSDLGRARLRDVVDPPNGWTVTLAVFAGIFESRGLVRVMVKRDGTRPMVLTDAGRAALKVSP